MAVHLNDEGAQIACLGVLLMKKTENNKESK
jgi:hypothetical protein